MVLKPLWLDRSFAEGVRIMGVGRLQEMGV
jgi:hypothetical protein